ncbi:LPXTG cell wall anchor domain-containing protein [Phytoactinopolyspora halotolerans]|uniref:LPXTG cell wall anchor domain-containing protein n=1 Tax=Phytoactinopolyspora halotolerans TaxID=1981512 RepID=A0A6L9S5R1_9ACTN|nr:LPXTG cell wall anchor domain-containing protein [Phytoactinopolyspora halotolerans]NED99409.1 LPXTG cell wall anchor domain-containing protein [Phytoactinopolyspora halotolerans]
MRKIRRSDRLIVATVLGLVGTGLASLPASAATGGSLADTGSSVQWWLIIAIAVLVIGGGLYAYSRWSSKKGSGTGADSGAGTSGE